MFNLFRSKPFIFGIVAQLFIMLLANLQEFGFSCDHCEAVRGFPFSFYRDFGYGFSYKNYILWFGLIANILVTVITSLIAGMAFKLIWESVLQRRLE